MAFKGVLPSPRERRIEASRLYAMTTGTPRYMMRRYSKVSARISGGVCKRFKTGRVNNCPARSSTMEDTSDRTAAFPMDLRRLSYLPAPNSCAIRIPKP